MYKNLCWAQNFSKYLNYFSGTLTPFIILHTRGDCNTLTLVLLNVYLFFEYSFFILDRHLKNSLTDYTNIIIMRLIFVGEIGFLSLSSPLF